VGAKDRVTRGLGDLLDAGRDIDTVVAFWAVSVLFVLTPGADWAYAMAAGIRHRTVVPSVGGLLVGHVAATFAVAAGIAALVARSPIVLTALTVVGTAYLVWLGIGTLNHPSTPIAGSEPDTTSWLRRFSSGAATSTLNPKVFLLFMALLPQFTDSSGSWPVAAQIMILGTVHVMTCAAAYYVAGAGAGVVLSTRPSVVRSVTRLAGAAMVANGVLLLLERVFG
jgi:threonine/homoserine/homoserine lactone efflux protein